MAFVRSPHAHARIVSIDASAAKALPGVIAVLTGAELAADGVGAFPISAGLAACRTVSPWRAPAVLPAGGRRGALRRPGRRRSRRADARAGRGRRRASSGGVQGAARGDHDRGCHGGRRTAGLAPDAPGNVAAQTELGRQEGVRCRVRQGQAHHEALAPQPAADPGDAWSRAAASRSSTRRAAASRCPHELPEPGRAAEDAGGRRSSRCRWTRCACACRDVGGGFGMKTMLYPEDAVCAYAARKLGRPVHWRASRSEEFLAGIAWARPDQPGRAGVRRRRQDPGPARRHRRQRGGLRRAAPAPSSSWRSVRR